MSHTTRAYIINANGLPGFVTSFEIVEFLKVENKAGRLEHAKRYQVVDLAELQQELETKAN